MVSVNTRLLYNVYGLVKAIVLMKGDYKLVYQAILYTQSCCQCYIPQV